jgi:hypothetical protein
MGLLKLKHRLCYGIFLPPSRLRYGGSAGNCFATEFWGNPPGASVACCMFCLLIEFMAALAPGAVASGSLPPNARLPEWVVGIGSSGGSFAIGFEAGIGKRLSRQPGGPGPGFGISEKCLQARRQNEALCTEGNSWAIKKRLIFYFGVIVLKSGDCFMLR